MTVYLKLFNYRNYIGSNDAQYLYIDYYRSKKEEIKQKEFDLQNRALMVVKENMIIKILKKIKKYFEKLVFQN